MAGKLSGKVAVVTGASKGIGAEIAVHLAAAGASVVVNYVTSKAGADVVVAKINSAGGRAVAAQANVAVQADVQRLFGEAKSAFGKVDVLVNNAGIYEFAPIEAVTVEHYRKQFDLNVLGVLLCTQEAIKLMPESGGSVVNISSTVSVSPQPNVSVYSATKGALDAITVSLARELGKRKIRVNSVNPGMVETEGFHAMGDAGKDFRKYIESVTPLSRIGQPVDIAPAVVFLASDDASWVTGEILPISGGMR